MSMIPPDELPADAMFEHFLDGDETLNAALSEMGEGGASDGARGRCPRAHPLPGAPQGALPRPRGGVRSAPDLALQDFWSQRQYVH